MRPFAPPQKRACPDAGFEGSADKHAQAASRNQVMFEELCNAHSHLSYSLQEISQSRHAEELRSRLLAKVSDTTAGRYLRSVQIFFATFPPFGAGASCGKVWTPGGGTKGSCPMSTPFSPLPCARATVPSSILA